LFEGAGGLNSLTSLQ